MKEIYTKLFPELKPYAKQFALVILLGVVITAFKGLIPDLTKELENSWREGDTRKATLIPLFIAGVFIFGAIARYFHMFWMKYIADLVAVSLRRRLMNKYLSLNLAFFQGLERGSGGLISRMLNDITLVQSGISRLADLVREPILVVVMLGYLIYIDWKLFLIILAIAPVTATIIRRLARSLRKYSHKNQESVEDLTKVLKESLDGTRVVQSFNLQDEMKSRFDSRADEFLATKRKIISREEASGPISEAIGAIAISVILVYLGMQLIGGQLTMGDFLAFSAAITLLREAFKKTQESYIQLQQGVVALTRVQQILDTENTLKVAERPRPFPEDWQEILFENVSFAFAGKEPVLKNINLKVKRGETLALVGSSGGGKSTLINLLMRFFDPTEGRILIGGVDIAEMDLNDLRAHIGLVSQDVFLFGDTLERNIQAGDFSKPVSEVVNAAKMANAHNFIMNSKGGYQSNAGDMGGLLSGGEKQRISIARAMFKNAPILLLDEATSALDSESEKEVQKGLDELLVGRTAFVIAHRLSTIANASRILVLKKGQIVEEGSHDELMKLEGEYRRFQSLQ